VDISVLILGESGTGKELIARSLHKNSQRASRPFRALNCSALPETLIESELFGYSRGAFTGASVNKPGLIEQAQGGTFFLDEVGDLTPAAQAKLLRVIQEREIQRLGETVNRKIDVRFLFATHKDLKKMVSEGNYREDLFYRISTSILRVPPLRERGEDVVLLANHLIEKYSRSFQKDNISISPSAARSLCEYFWPGNVRELENVIQALLVNCESGARIDARDLPSSVRENRQLRNCSGMSLEDARGHFEREFLMQALNIHRWNKTQTARELRITRQGLISMIQRLGLKEPIH
jgi:transcriptional regulator with PAS, ATPase and Fis domain